MAAARMGKRSMEGMKWWSLRLSRHRHPILGGKSEGGRLVWNPSMFRRRGLIAVALRRLHETTPSSSCTPGCSWSARPSFFAVPATRSPAFCSPREEQYTFRSRDPGQPFLYAHGLLLNDLADLADPSERPNRPLPSGAAQPRRRLQIVAVTLAVLALLLCWAAATSLAVRRRAPRRDCALWIPKQKIAVLGPIDMGLCRGLSLLLGAAAAAPNVCVRAVPRTPPGPAPSASPSTSRSSPTSPASRPRRTREPRASSPSSASLSSSPAFS